jgi:hypothetical protein
MSLRSKAFAVLVGLGVASSAWGAAPTDSAVGPAYRGAVQSHKTVGPAMRGAVQSQKTVGPMGSGAVRSHKTVGPDARSTERSADQSPQAPQKAEGKAQLDLNAGF